MVRKWDTHYLEWVLLKQYYSIWDSNSICHISVPNVTLHITLSQQQQKQLHRKESDLPPWPVGLVNELNSQALDLAYAAMEYTSNSN